MARRKPAPVLPRCLIKAYRKNCPANGKSLPDLMICEDPNDPLWYTFSGTDVDRGLYDSFKNKQEDHRSWLYERLEVYADGQQLTFVMPTIGTESGGSQDSIGTIQGNNPVPGTGKETFLYIRCHMLLLNGEEQNDGGTDRTSFGLKFTMYRHSDGRTWVQDVELGAETWPNPIALLAFGNELQQGQFKENLKGPPGPLLQAASISAFAGSDNLAISLRNINTVPTFVLVFTPDPSHSPLDLTSSTSAKLPIPVRATKGSFQITQRPSDDWLKRKVDEEWLVEIECDGFEDLWNNALTQYRNALKTVRPVNRITLIPSIAIASTSADTFNLHVQLTITRTLNQDRPYAAHFEDLHFPRYIVTPAQKLNATLAFHLGGETRRNYSADITELASDQANKSFAFNASFKADSTPQPSRLVRIGSLDLEFGVGGTPGLPTQILQLLDLSQESLTVPRFHTKMFFPITSLTPGGQDGLPSSEYAPENYDEADGVAEQCIENRFTGSAPVVIAPTGNSQQGSYRLSVDESNPNLYSDTVFLRLDSTQKADAAPVKPLRVIVVDSDPLLVAAVDYSLFQPGANSTTVALWNTGELEGAAWQLQNNAQPFALTLPPQVLGEEMPKAHELDSYDPPNDTDDLQSFDFRFSPAAMQQLQGSYTPQNFADAPWNLRRILGYPGQRDPGAGVVQLNYELLYGLSCTAAAPLMRLAEIFSLLGRIPGRIPKNGNLLDQPIEAGKADSSPIAIYQSERTLWSFYAALYNTRVAILEPRMPGANFGLTVGASGASGPPEVLTLSSGVQCTLRNDADLFYSLDPQDLAAVDNDTFPPKSPNLLRPPGPGLRGGVTWPFESPRLFHATVRNPKSSSAIVSGLELSPLGGSGKQKIGFDNDLSTISSDTEIGRNSKISVARLGRIGCFHNLARYVIEYERDVVTSKQFAADQTAFKGRPALRKVREFVEVLEPIAYLSNSSQVVPGAGCVNSIEFKQTIIPVTHKWSSNVGQTGWKIPLWFEPDAPPPQIQPGDTTFYYPLPTTVFNLAGSDGGADVECTLQTVGKLFFYTDTDPKADSDPHNWPVVPGVDFYPICACKANPPFPGASVNELPAYDPPVPFGLSAFTHTIIPGHSAVNLVNGRTAQAIGATLTNLTLQRGPQTALNQWQQKVQAVHDLIRKDIFTAVRSNPQDVNGLATALTKSVNEFQSALATQATSLVSGITSQETALLKRYAGQVVQEIDLVQDELKARFQNLVGAEIQKVKDAAHLEVDAFFQRLEGIPVTANALANFAYSCEQTLVRAQQQLTNLNQQLATAFQNASTAVSATGSTLRANLVALNAALTEPLHGIEVLLANVRAQVQARAESWMPAAPIVCHVWENKICAATSKFQDIVAQINTVIADLDASADDRIAADSKALTDAIAAVNATVLGAIVLDSGPLSGFAAEVGCFGDYLLSVQTMLKTAQSGSKDLIDTTIDGALTDTTKLISGDVDLIAKALVDLLLKRIDVVANLSDEILANADAVAKKLIALLSNFSDEVNQAISTLQSSLNNAQEAARRAAEHALGRFMETVAQALPPIGSLPPLDAVLPSGAQVATILQRAFGTAPAIPNLGFSLPNVAYFFQQADPHISLTPLLTHVKDLGSALSPLSTLVPSFQLLDRAIPVPSLPSFDLSSVFPDFAGLKLSNLFPSLKLPSGAVDGIKITHGLDAQSRQAWVQANIDLQTAPATIFSIGPMALQIQNARFQSQVRAQADSTGQVARHATGSITGDWQLLIGGSPMITLAGTTLSFDENGKIHVNVSPDRVQLSAALSFVQQIIAQYTSPDGGFGIFPSATGIETRLSLPIPDTSLGTTGITNLTFNFLFGLSWANDFELYAGFGLASPNKPFNLSVFILGGGGHLVATARFRPGGSGSGAGKLTCQVDMALDASASLSIAFGPLSGFVGIALGMRFIFNSGQGDLSLGIFLLIVGEASILSIVSANITLRLEATYENGSFTGRGLFSISIKICWCFTLNVSQQVSCHLGSAGGQALNEPIPMPWHADLATDAPNRVLSLSTIPSQSVLDNYSVLATRYINLIS